MVFFVVAFVLACDGTHPTPIDDSRHLYNLASIRAMPSETKATTCTESTSCSYCTRRQIFKYSKHLRQPTATHSTLLLEKLKPCLPNMYVNIPDSILKKDRIWNDYEIAHAVCVKAIGPPRDSKNVLIFIRCITLQSRTRIHDFWFKTLHQVAHFSVCGQKDYDGLIPKFRNLWCKKANLKGYDVRYCSKKIDLELICEYLQTLKLRESRLSTGDIALSSRLQKAIQGSRLTGTTDLKKHAKLLFEGKYEQFSGLESLRVDDRGQLLYSPDGEFHSQEITTLSDFDGGKFFFPFKRCIGSTKTVDNGFVIISSMREFYSICEGVVLEFEFKKGSAAHHAGCVIANTCALDKLITLLQGGTLGTKAIIPQGGWIRQYDIQESRNGFLIDRPLLTQPSEYCDTISYHVGLSNDE